MTETKEINLGRWCYRCVNNTKCKYGDTCKKIDFCKKEFNKRQEYIKNLSYSIGDKIKFKNEKRPYKITACNNRYILAVKPFNLQHTYLYVLVDIKEMVRGADNFKCYGDYSNLKEAAEILKLCDKGEIEVSYRNFRRLDIEKVIKAGYRSVFNG